MQHVSFMVKKVGRIKGFHSYQTKLVGALFLLKLLIYKKKKKKRHLLVQKQNPFHNSDI